MRCFLPDFGLIFFSLITFVAIFQMWSWIFGFNFAIKDCPEFGFILNRRHPAMLWSAGDVKEHTRLSLREGQEVSGVVVWSLLFKWGLGWEMLGDMSYHKATLQSEGKLSIHIHNIHMSCHVMSCHVMLCHVISCHVMSCHAISCMSRHVMLCHVMSCHIKTCHAIVVFLISR